MEYINNKSVRNSDNTVDKLPFFLNKSGSPKTWFQLLEAKFDFSALSSTNKFYQALSCLPLDILKLLSDDLVEVSTSCNPYNSLKDLLYEYYKGKPNEIIENYFSKNSRSGCKPSEYLNKAIEDLESQYPGITKDNDQIMRHSFISGLPPLVQKIVNGISNIELRKLADFADKISEKQPVKNTEMSNEISSDDKIITYLSTELFSLKLQLQTLQENFNRLEQQVNSKNKTQNKQHVSTPKSSSRPSSPTINSDLHTFNDKNKPRNLCFYHLKYGSGALKCQLGCSFQPKPLDLKISNICIFHAKYNGDSSQCVPGCTRYTNFNGHTSR